MSTTSLRSLSVALRRIRAPQTPFRKLLLAAPVPAVHCLPFSSAPIRQAARPVKYTSDSYPELTRNQSFAQLTDEHVQHFKAVLGDAAIIGGVNDNGATADIEPFNRDWMGKYRGHTQLVLRPKSTAEVSAVLAYCNEHRLAVVPQGGNTGLVGGSVPVFDEIVVSTARMNCIRSFDPNSGILVVDAGVVLEAADSFLREHGHLFPLDLGAKGSCQIGGNVSTNAGGLRLLRYGSLHGNVLGLEAVLPDGTVVDDLSTLRKNNTGYDLKQLFIGAEGTIGIVTGVSIVCPPKPKAVNVAYLAAESFDNVKATFLEAKSQLSEILSACELMGGNTQTLVETVTGLKRPLEGDHPFYCVIETSGSNPAHDSQKLESFLESVLEAGIIADGVVAQDETQSQTLWRFREGITEALTHMGPTYKYDLSIPLNELYQLVNDTRARFVEAGMLSPDDPTKPVRDVFGYGHLGDANLHLNVAARQYSKEIEAVLEPWVYEWIAARRGSISAEHGLGLTKKAFIGFSKSDTMQRLMAQVKKIYDPVSGAPYICLTPANLQNGIMNPYKYL